jgi:hypothetical protein
MNRFVGIAAGAMGGIALLGVGVAVGSQVGRQEALIAAADVQGPLTTQDSFLLQSFIRASTQFDKFVTEARKGKSVGDGMTKQAVIVLNVERQARSPELHDAADAVGQAMLLIGAGVIANDGGTVKQGLDQYKVGQEKVALLTDKINADAAAGGAQAPAPSATDSPAPQPSAGE